MRPTVFLPIISILFIPSYNHAADLNFLTGFVKGMNDTASQRREQNEFNQCIQQYGYQACQNARNQMLLEEQQKRIDAQEQELRNLEARQRRNREELEQRINDQGR